MPRLEFTACELPAHHLPLWSSGARLHCRCHCHWHQLILSRCAHWNFKTLLYRRTPHEFPRLGLFWAHPNIARTNLLPVSYTHLTLPTTPYV